MILFSTGTNGGHQEGMGVKRQCKSKKPMTILVTPKCSGMNAAAVYNKTIVFISVFCITLALGKPNGQAKSKKESTEKKSGFCRKILSQKYYFESYLILLSSFNMLKYKVLFILTQKVFY